MRAGLIQLCSSDQPDENIPVVLDYMRGAAKGGAEFLLTPEVTNCVSNSRAHQQNVLRHQEEDPTLAALSAEAQALGVWLLIGSLALKTHDGEARFANRSFLITPGGKIAAHYDKIHMFDVDIDANESFRESAAYRPGDRAVVADTDFGRLGMTICYDVRFAQLHRKLAKAGASILTSPAAFSPVSGAAHWEPLLRARAIETGCFMLAPAQCGTHEVSAGKPRRTHGHSLAIGPWGEVLADAGSEPGVTLVDLDLSQVKSARSRIPSLTHDRSYDGPMDE